MKHLLYFLFFSLSFISSAQTPKIAGTYQFNFKGEKDGSVIKRTLTLNPDGTFLFHRYRKLVCTSCKEEHWYAKGTWKANKKVISFYTSKTDLNKKYIYNFNNTKARFNSKSSRNTSTVSQKNQIIIYESDIFWLKGLKLTMK